jgi:hypothetical protein
MAAAEARAPFWPVRLVELSAADLCLSGARLASFSLDLLGPPAHLIFNHGLLLALVSDLLLPLGQVRLYVEGRIPLGTKPCALGTIGARCQGRPRCLARCVSPTLAVGSAGRL